MFLGFLEKSRLLLEDAQRFDVGGHVPRNFQVRRLADEVAGHRARQRHAEQHELGTIGRCWLARRDRMVAAGVALAVATTRHRRARSLSTNQRAIRSNRGHSAGSIDTTMSVSVLKVPSFGR